MFNCGKDRHFKNYRNYIRTVTEPKNENKVFEAMKNLKIVIRAETEVDTLRNKSPPRYKSPFRIPSPPLWYRNGELNLKEIKIEVDTVLKGQNVGSRLQIVGDNL